MLTLHIFGPAYGLPEGSPFGIKAIMLLKLAGLPFETKRSDLRKAPRRKLPVLDDDGEIIPDSTFIRMHLEAERCQFSTWTCEKFQVSSAPHPSACCQNDPPTDQTECVGTRLRSL